MAERKRSTTRIDTLSLENDSVRRRADELATEEPMEVRVVARTGAAKVAHRVAVTMRTPGHDFELALGFLFTEGVVRHRSAIQRVTYCGIGDRDAGCTASDAAQRHNIVTVHLERGVPFDPARLSRHVYTSSSCGICGKGSLELVRAVCPGTPVGTLRLGPARLVELPGALRRAQAIFKRTGGLHASALFDGSGRLLIVREDVGRHNAMDKLVGALLLDRRLPASNAVVLLSGRASFELVQKAAMAGIPVVAAVGPPSSLAVDLASELGMTLIGFLRDGRFNVYCGADRVDLPPAEPAWRSTRTARAAVVESPSERRRPIRSGNGARDGR